MLTEAYWVRYTRRVLAAMEAQGRMAAWRALRFKARLRNRKRRHFVMQGGGK